MANLMPPFPARKNGEKGALPVLKAFETEKHTVTISFKEEKTNE